MICGSDDLYVKKKKKKKHLLAVLPFGEQKLSHDRRHYILNRFRKESMEASTLLAILRGKKIMIFEKKK